MAFAITTPSGTSISDSLPWVERLLRAFGTPNNVYGTEICNWHKDHATRYTFGTGIGTPDLDHAGCVLLWGHNPTGSWLAQGQRGKRGEGARGAARRRRIRAGRGSPRRRMSGCGCARAPTGRSPSASRG